LNRRIVAGVTWTIVGSMAGPSGRALQRADPNGHERHQRDRRERCYQRYDGALDRESRSSLEHFGTWLGEEPADAAALQAATAPFPSEQMRVPDQHARQQPAE
jgi:hypothetical protein